MGARERGVSMWTSIWTMWRGHAVRVHVKHPPVLQVGFGCDRDEEHAVNLCRYMSNLELLPSGYGMDSSVELREWRARRD